MTLRTLRSKASFAAVGATLLGAALAPSPASACGGFFCSSQPMDQAGENILFSVESDGSMTAYIQIFYQGSADQFAWILPLPSVPTLSVGTNALFTQLEQRTAPAFVTNTEIVGTCRSEPGCSYPPYAADGTRGGGYADAGAAAADAGPSGVVVEFHGTVGPYDAAVLSGGTAAELLDWLTTNGYQIPASSTPLIDDYVHRGHHFVAIRLTADHSTAEIQPLVLHYTEASPCVPIQLTSIATVPDMPITAYFLAEGRAVPVNYAIVEPRFDDEGLWLGTTSYASWVTHAVDAAGGHAFVTDFAGAPPTDLGLTLPSVTDLARPDATPAEILLALFSRGYRSDAQILALFERFLPPPPGMDARSYYNCLARGYGCDTSYLPPGWDPVAFVTAIDTTITQPRAEAERLVGSHSRMTRLTTTMSAEEMTLDPTFRVDPALSDVSNVHTATMRYLCDAQHFVWSAPRHLVLPSGRDVTVSEGVAYTGSDAAYCQDYTNGSFAPWTPLATARETARRRALEPTGGGGCSVAAPGASGAGASVLIGLALAGLFVARRRRA